MRRSTATMGLVLSLFGCQPTNTDQDASVDAATDASASVDASGIDASLALSHLRRASRSASIVLTDDGKRLAMVNSDEDSVSVFTTADNQLLARIPTGEEPSAVVIAPDSKTLFVAHRKAATVVKITDADTGSPNVGTPVMVGSEPTGLALSPTGSRLYVAEFGEGRVSVIDTATMQRTSSINEPLRPRTIAVTNDLDNDDDDELIIVPEFYGEPNVDGEVRDTGRTGRVRLYRTQNLAAEPAILLGALDSGFGVTASPNQLSSVAFFGGRLFVTAIAAAPAGAPQFDQNVFPFIHVASLNSENRQEVRIDAEHKVGTISLTKVVFDAIAKGQPRFALGDVVDFDFVDGRNISYAVARASKIVERIVWDDTSGVSIGSTVNKQIDIAGDSLRGTCESPNGIALDGAASRAYINCAGNARLAVIDLAAQSLLTTVVSAPAFDTAAARGKQLFFNGRGRWSNEGWSSCGSCHPDGLSDGITWQFSSGPRQTTSLDGAFSHGPGAQKQRVFNWSAIFDEVHDFERNVRDVSGGLGAITQVDKGKSCATFADERAVPLSIGNSSIGGLDLPLREIAEDPANCVRTDWTDIESYLKVIRPPRAPRSLDSASVTRGRTLFSTGNCQFCHAGAGWTFSRRYYTPTSSSIMGEQAADFTVPTTWRESWSLYGGGKRIAPQPAAADTTQPGANPKQVVCVLRNVGTFGIAKDAMGTAALEVNSGGDRAQGAGGYNIPSLYGLSLSAPYLHHGQAGSLRDLFTDERFDAHTNAGNANFRLGPLQAAGAVDDLVNFLLAIDPTTEEIVADPMLDGCPNLKE